MRATDDFEVKDVTLTIRLASGEILRVGPAHRTPGDGDLFLYRTTAAPARGSEVTIEAVARDWPDNVVTRTASWVNPPG